MKVHEYLILQRFDLHLILMAYLQVSNLELTSFDYEFVFEIAKCTNEKNFSMTRRNQISFNDKFEC